VRWEEVWGLLDANPSGDRAHRLAEALDRCRRLEYVNDAESVLALHRRMKEETLEGKVASSPK
jgi:hypothetical protein